MTRALVVVESMFGNTRQVAEAVAEGLRESRIVEVVEVVDVAAAPSAPSADVLVLGGPTHAFGMSRPATRADAVARGASVSERDRSTGLREYLDALRHASQPSVVATFDTRIRKRGLPGSAARAARRRLVRAGSRAPLPPESFFVADVAGPLLPGELDRARAWGARLAGAVAAR
jgi:hypothetical protein